MSDSKSINDAGTFVLPETLASRPRKVVPVGSRRGWRRWATLTVAALLFALSALIALIMIVDIFWVVKGIDQTALVRSVRVVTEGKEVAYFADVDLRLEGHAQSHALTISHAEYERFSAMGLASGASASTGEIRVRTLYLGSHAFTSKAIGHDETPAGKLADASIIRVAILLAAGGGALWLAVLEPRRIAKLYREGVASPGQIVISTSADPRQRMYCVWYKFETSDDQLCTGRHFNIDRKEHGAADVGQLVTVLHPEGKPKPSVIYEFGGYRCE